VAARAGGAGWWAGKVRQFGGHIRARVERSEREALVAWLTPVQLAAFDAMHVADRRHGLDVVNALRRDGLQEPDVLLAGLLHDAGKGRTGVLPRVAYSLGQAYGTWVWRVASILPGFAGAIDRLRDHPERSAAIAAAAGCSDRTVDLIRHQDRPLDPQFGELLRLADEAN
jgi:hypothetical protein